MIPWQTDYLFRWRSQAAHAAEALLKVVAFTLTELLIVLVIAGILVLLALPRLMPLVGRTRSSISGR